MERFLTLSLIMCVASLLPLSATGMQDDHACSHQHDEHGRRLFIGTYGSEAARVGEEVQAVVDQNSGTVAGAQYCSHYEGIEVYVVAEADSARNAVEMIADATTYPIHIRTADHSLDRLLEELATISDLPADLGVVAIAPDVTGEGLVVSTEVANDASWLSQSDALDHLTESLDAEVPLRFQPGSVSIPATRAADSAPYDGGINIYCSLIPHSDQW